MAYPIIETSTKKMDKVIDHLKDELSTIRTGMASPAMLNHVEVDYYGTPTPVNQIAGISIQEGRIIVIKPYDRSSLKDIERACNEADLGIAPQNDGTVIRLAVEDIGIYGRSTIGVRIINVKDGNKVASVAIMKASEEDEETESDNEDVPRETIEIVEE